jgi:hypothetical protein
MNLLLSSILRAGILVCGVVILAIGCSKSTKPDESAGTQPAKPAGASVDSGTPDAPPPPPTPPPIAGSGEAPPGTAPGTTGDPGEVPPSLQQVRDALVQWTFQHNNPPKDLNELVKEGYLKRLPVPPPGKRFSLDPRTMTVTLVD